MRRKISLILCMLAVMLCFTGCASSQKEELEYDKESVTQVTEFLIGFCAQSDQATFDRWRDMTDFALEQQINGAGLAFTPESFLGALDSWEQGIKESGEYESHGDYKFEVSNSELTVTTDVKFADRKGVITFKFDEKLYLDSMTVDAIYTKGEILEKAGLNTLLGMGTVFSVLIFISLIISLFRFIPVIQNAFSKKPAKVVKEKEELVGSEVVAQKEVVTDDSELIAVISAAIAAAEGTTTNGFVVRSIKRRPANRWN